jgi:CRISPR-associated protein Cas2
MSYAFRMSQRQLFIAAYDIRDSKRLRNALKVVRAYASGGQKSVYECFLTAHEKSTLLAEVSEVIDAAEDRFFLLRLDARGRVYTLGKAVPPQDGAFYYIG